MCSDAGEDAFDTPSLCAAENRLSCATSSDCPMGVPCCFARPFFGNGDPGASCDLNCLDGGCWFGCGILGGSPSCANDADCQATWHCAHPTIQGVVMPFGECDP
jgi:hypothetical protein